MIEGIVLERIVSGGQTGADQAALRAARTLGLKTGGIVPKGWRTLDGPAPWLVSYGCIESASQNYQRRTEANVGYAEATVRFAVDFQSPGEICTMKAIKKYKRPSWDIEVDFECMNTWGFLTFLQRHEVRTLNVAGNSEKTAPGIGAWVEAFIVNALAHSSL